LIINIDDNSSLFRILEETCHIWWISWGYLCLCKESFLFLFFRAALRSKESLCPLRRARLVNWVQKWQKRCSWLVEWRWHRVT